MSAENGEFQYNPSANYDEAIMAQQRQIEKEISQQQVLVGGVEDLSALESEYKDDPVFIAKIQNLKGKYSSMRRTRGDGNCFFRAFGYGYLEQLLGDKKEHERFREIAANSKDILVNLGFPQFTLEDFHDTFMNVVDTVGKPCTRDELFEIFNNQCESDYLVVYLRLLVSGHLQKNEDFFRDFIEGHLTMKEFCNHEVEPMCRESDHIHIIALTAALNVPLRVVYMDRGEGNDVTSHDFPEDSTPRLFLLYRPGHYDLLYKQ